MLSVVLTSYNYARFLQGAIEAILSQSLQPDEFIIIEDASTDNSAEIIRGYGKNNPVITLIQNEGNKGVIASLNLGLKLAQGKYLVYATADDLVLQGFFDESIRLLEDNPQAAFCSALVTSIDKGGNGAGRVNTPIVAGKGFIPPQDVRRLMRRHGFWLTGSTVVFRRQHLVQAGGFTTELGPLADSFICQVLALRHGTCFIPEYLARWRRSENSYVASTLADGLHSLAYMNYAQELIKSKYQDLFPVDYAKNWEREWIYAIGLNAGKGSINEHNAYLDSLKRILEPLNWFDRLLLFSLKSMTIAKTMFVRIYLNLRFKQLTWAKIKRRQMYINLDISRWIRNHRFIRK